MEPASKVVSNLSTKSYLEREMFVTLDNDGPMIGPTLETMDTTDHSTELDPHQFSRLKKNIILFVVAIAGAMSPIASTAYFPAVTSMQKYFNTDSITMNASFAIFIFFTAFFPLLWAILGDRFGRRNVYLVSFMIAIAGNVCCAVSVNVQMFIAFRAMSAIGSSSVLSMGAGTITDIFEPCERGRAFAYYYFGPLLGPSLGPIIGGYLNEGLGWRSNFWFLSIFALCILLGIFFFLPETSRPMSEKEMQRRSKGINPLNALRLLLYPNIAMTAAFIGVLFFMQYLNSTIFTRVYTDQYDLSSGIVGVCYLPYAIGAMAGGNMGGRISDRVYNKRVERAREDGQEVYPEMRLSGLVLGISVIVQLLSLTAYGWCIDKNVHFAYGLVCQFIYGTSFMLPNVTLGAYMVDCFRKESATVTACNNLVRYIMAGIGSLIASDIANAMGQGPLFTFGGALITLFSINIYFIKRYYKKWAAQRKN